MGRLAKRAVVTVLAITFLGIAPPVAQAQVGGVTAFCAASIESNSAESKAEMKAAIDKLVAVAPPAIVSPATELRDIFTKKGKRGIETARGIALVNQIDGWVYDNCPGTRMPVTASDFAFQGIPATMRAGLTEFKLTNSSSKEDHEMVFIKLLPAGEGMDPEKLLALPDKKLGKYFDFSGTEFMFAPASGIGYAYADLAPGKYLYSCFLPVGGKETGKPHWVKGMYGATTVS